MFLVIDNYSDLMEQKKILMKKKETQKLALNSPLKSLPAGKSDCLQQ